MKKYYFIGIGGVSMSALAIMLKDKGYFVRGYDASEGKGTEILSKNGIVVDFDFNADAVKDADVIVVSSAIKTDDKRLLLARKLKKRIISRGELLGQISSDYEKVVAVAGSHGKTTTTAMIENILYVAGKNPTLHLGGFKIADDKNYRLGGEEFFVTEACEYHDNFLFLRPYISVVTNIEKEHLDYFKTFENEKHSFDTFKKNSLIVVDSFEGISAKKVRHDKTGRLKFSLFRNGKELMKLHLHICEDVNTQNCIYAYLVAKRLGIDDCIIKQGLETFLGTHTRFERVVSKFFDVVFCDYAHHPTEIEKAIRSAKKIFKGRPLVTIFQPHTYSRTKNLLNDFIAVFKNVDYPFFYKTYAAREKEQDGLSAKQFTDILKKYNKNAKYFDNFLNLSQFLIKFTEKKPILLFLGAGDLPAILHKNQFIT